MRGKRAKIPSSGHSAHTWRKRPSEIRGFQRALYMTAENGDYLRVDFNVKEKKVRLYIEIASEGGSPYYSVITNGKITAEKSVQSGRSFAFADRFNERASLFETIPQRDVLRLMTGQYGIGAPKDKKPKTSEPRDEKEQFRAEVRRRYFRRESWLDGDDDEAARARTFRFRPVDLIDIAIGAFLSGGLFFLFQYSYVAMGITAAFFGIIIGFVDMFFRRRPPLISKVLLFVVSGISSYIYGYFFP